MLNSIILNECLGPLITGCCTGGSLIVAIGAQNAFVLSQGLKRQFVFVVALLCALIDALLISAGVAGFGCLVQQSPYVVIIATWGGAIFLFFYGLRSFLSAAKHNALTVDEAQSVGTLSGVIFTLLALSFLNPHVYLDTVVLIGSIATQYSDMGRVAFATGAIISSFVWFFSLAYGSVFLRPLFQKPIAWQILDTLIGITMWAIAGVLIWNMYFS
ncbi:MAG: amino acid transporter [Alphaproteobacteria bacterium]|jgi:L-lysine exporter family protein LysE/ArgO|nr:amino acid transporter [Alphaproteobacteria bacterium]MBT5389902.1 amino acid transporter [Alphaproteobacteria bacterium]MBT5653958.1 amino acid transporter [Alphaproteobacteria bacterium]